MPVSPAIREAEEAARIALLQVIKSKAKEVNVEGVHRLSEAYHFVTSTNAPIEPSKDRGAKVF